MKNIFDKEVTEEIIGRIEKLNKNSQPVWGKMDVSQMFAHCCVTYELIFENTQPKPNKFKKMILGLLIKNIVVGTKPYKTNSRTAPEFLITEQKDFETEKTRLISFIRKTQELGVDYFEQKESHSFGKLTSKEWNNMFYKHLDHHLHQFSV
ncbi:DUF1569 domain-containing protein [Flavicella marina]|uniref:DUF1569 domain-containing protein n=1 Tax=Flavicella marina TaxID=1475951 RepID=UPI001264A870|nr:DUF1569 domain-containing protein [Flavicella marina]